MRNDYFRKVIGLDIGRHAAKAVVAARCWRGVNFLDAAWVRLPASPEERHLVLQSMVLRNGWANLPCVVSLHRRNAMVNVVEIDPQDPRSIGEIVAMEMEQFNGLAEQRTITAHTMQRMPDGRRAILLAIGRREEIDLALEASEDIGLAPVDVLPAAIAMFNTVARCVDSPSAPFAGVEVGHSGTDVVVGFRSTILFARHFPVGCSALAEGRSVGGTTATAHDASPETWLRELLACLNLYRAQVGKSVPSLKRMVFCGGGGMVDRLVKLAGAQTGLETSRLSAMPKHPPLDEPDRYAVAAGLVMAGLGRGCQNVSLLPATSRQRIMLRRKRRYWAMAAAALLMAAVVGVLTLYRTVDECRDLLDRRRGELASYHELEQKLSAYRQRNEELVNHLRPFRLALRNGPVVQHILGSVAEAKHPDDWIILLADARSYFDRPPFASGATGYPGEGESNEESIEEGRESGVRQVVIEGYTPVNDLSTVRSMIEALRSSPVVQEVDLLGDDRVRMDPDRDRRWASANCRLFAVEATLTP